MEEERIRERAEIKSGFSLARMPVSRCAFPTQLNPNEERSRHVNVFSCFIHERSAVWAKWAYFSTHSDLDEPEAVDVLDIEQILILVKKLCYICLVTYI